MDMYPKYKSPFGYQVGDNGIDSYGVNHSGFSLRDEIEYQTARDQRESQLMQMYNNQGITENYPQYTTNFWGDSGNNYGFGSSNITSAISAHPAMNTMPTPLQPAQTQIPQAQASVLTNADTTLWSGGYSNYTLDNQKRQCNVSSGMQCAPQNGNYIANMTPMHPDYSQPASLEFDGKNLIWLQNGKPVKYYPAMSGKPDHQTARDTNIPDMGPIPEGRYILPINSGEHHEPGK